MLKAAACFGTGLAYIGFLDGTFPEEACSGIICFKAMCRDVARVLP